MYIYIDVVVLLNLCVNTALLLLTAWALNLDYAKIKLAAAVFILTAYVVLLLICPWHFCGHPLIKIMVSATAVFVAFGKKKWRGFIVTLGTFYFISFLLGGAVFGYYFFCRDFVSQQDFTSSGFSLSSLFQGMFVGVLLFFGLAKYLVRRKSRGAFITKIRLQNNERQVIVDGFWDSGNQLYDITGRKPVILVEKGCLHSLFSAAANQFLAKIDEKEWFQTWPLCEDETWKKNMTLVSYRSIGHASFLLGQRLAQVEVKQKGEWQPVDCVIGIYPRELSPDHSYQALLHSSMCFK